MPASGARIDRLSLSVPAASREQGIAVAAEVTRRLGLALAAAPPSRRLGALRLTVTAAPGASAAQLAAAIAAAIARSVR